MQTDHVPYLPITLLLRFDLLLRIVCCLDFIAKLKDCDTAKRLRQFVLSHLSP